jgi:hypothetical protein
MIYRFKKKTQLLLIQQALDDSDDGLLCLLKTEVYQRGSTVQFGENSEEQKDYGC